MLPLIVLTSALLPGLAAPVGILVLLTRGVLATLLAAMLLIVLPAVLAAALMLTTLMLLALILIHRCLHASSQSVRVNPRRRRPFLEFRGC